MISIAEPEVNDVQNQEQSGGTEGQGPQTVQAAVESDLADDTQLEITDGAGNKQIVTLAQLRDMYIDRDRHRKASDQKFTEADKMRKGVQSEVARAIKDPNSFLKWIETQRPDFKTVDYFFQQLEQDADPRIIDRLAALLQKKLDAEKTEQEMSPADRRLREVEAENARLKQQYEDAMDLREEQALFDGVKGAISAAGLNPTPLVAIMALEVIADARTRGVDLSHAQAAALLKEQVTGAAEQLFKREPTQPRDPATGKFQTAPRQRPGSTDVGAAAAAKRQAKENAPRVSVVGKGKKKEEPKEQENVSFLDAIRSAYSSVN